jgi:hypothetical protein
MFVASLTARSASTSCLVELIQLGPKDQWGNLLAQAIGHIGQVFLEKSGAVEGEMTH